MGSIANAFSSSIGKKLVMGLTGLFLISFLVIHCFLNSFVFFDRSGGLFNMGAHFMATNWIIRAMEVFLMLGLLLHIYQGYNLWLQNQKARPVKYAYNNGNANSKWYSRSMGLLGTLLLMFLIVHLSDFWVVSRFTGIDEFNGVPVHDPNAGEDLYHVMLVKFSQPWRVILYVLAMISLSYHLMHGFASAFQTMGWNHKKYTPIIKAVGFWFSILIPLIFALMPIAIHFGWGL